MQYLLLEVIQVNLGLATCLVFKNFKHLKITEEVRVSRNENRHQIIIQRIAKKC